MATGLLLDHADARAQAVRREAFALGGAPLHVAGGLRPIDAEPTHAELEQTMGVWCGIGIALGTSGALRSVWKLACGLKVLCNSGPDKVDAGQLCTARSAFGGLRG
eukprot:2174980-Pleurochrysis_carterae.AAC.1